MLGTGPPFSGFPFREFCVLFPEEIIPLTEGVTESPWILRGSSWDKGVGGIELEEPAVRG